MNKSVFRVIIAGGRDSADRDVLFTMADHYLSDKAATHDIVIVSGTARGADALGEIYASERGYAIRRFPADWERYGRAAGHKRNAEMADNADALISFWDGKSRGTKNMIETATKKGLLVRVVKY